MVQGSDWIAIYFYIKCFNTKIKTLYINIYIAHDFWTFKNMFLFYSNSSLKYQHLNGGC